MSQHPRRRMSHPQPAPAAGTTVLSVARRGHLLAALAHPGFRRLFGVRLAGQFGDGVFQASLAGAVLFNPRAPGPRRRRRGRVRRAAAAVLADRAVRRRAARPLVAPAGARRPTWCGRWPCSASPPRSPPACTASRSTPARWSSSRSAGSSCPALSAALPHVVDAERARHRQRASRRPPARSPPRSAGRRDRRRGARRRLEPRLRRDRRAARRPVPARPASGRAASPPPPSGPTSVERGNRETVRHVARGLVAGARHVYARKPALHALTTIGVHRLCYGVTTVCTLLLYRNYFHDDGHLPRRARRAGPGRRRDRGRRRAGRAGHPGGHPAARASVRWPAAAARRGRASSSSRSGCPTGCRWCCSAAVLLGFTAQGIKISVDTLVQRTIADEFRGRVFALYDTLFNLTLVVVGRAHRRRAARQRPLAGVGAS